MLFPAKRRKVVTDKNKKMKENVSTESTLSSVVDIVTEGSIAPLRPSVSQFEAQTIEIEVIDEADEAFVAQDSVYESSSILVTSYVFSIIFIGRVGFYSHKCIFFSFLFRILLLLEEMLCHELGVETFTQHAIFLRRLEP